MISEALFYGCLIAAAMQLTALLVACIVTRRDER